MQNILIQLMMIVSMVVNSPSLSVEQKNAILIEVNQIISTIPMEETTPVEVKGDTPVNPVVTPEVKTQEEKLKERRGGFSVSA